jgi:hypothetical protein
MSDLGKLFRLSQGEPKPLENFTTAVLAIAINHDQRPIVQALKHVDRSGNETKSFPVLDSFLGTRADAVSVSADIQKTLFPDAARLGYLDLVLSVRHPQRTEGAVWIEVKVDAWESGDQIPVYLAHAERQATKPDVITLGRTKITDKVPFLRWANVVDAIESVSNPHYCWVSLREFLLEEKIVRPTVRSLPADAAACIDIIIDVNKRIRHLWPDAGMAWMNGALRKALEKTTERELLAPCGPIIYGLTSIDGIWQWCIRFTVRRNHEGVRLYSGRVLADAASLHADWTRYPDQPELLERRLQPGNVSAPDEIVQWFDEGLQQLHQAGVVNSYLEGLAEKRERRRRARQKGDSASPTASD